MKKVKNFKDFLNEMLDVQNSEDIEIDDEFVQDEFVQDEFVQDEFAQGYVQKTWIGDDTSDVEEHEPEEIEDLMELIYNKKTEQWEYEGEMDLPSDFDVFYDWFVDEVSEENTTTSMKEEGYKVVFHIPEDLYIEYLEEIEKGVPDEVEDIEDQYQEEDDIKF